MDGSHLPGFTVFRYFPALALPILLLAIPSMTSSEPAATRPDIPSPAELKKLPPDGGKNWNRLVFEQSPYLLQHAANPVDWWPWCREAFDRAKAEDKPVFLSVGYSTCHWCHVMEHESFENPEIAKLLNEFTIPIKVDREERPDIDHVYMTVTQAMTGQGGWPMTVVMTPEKEPFFAGTYFPPESVHGRIGMADLIPALSKAWREDRERVLQSAGQVAEVLQNVGGNPPVDLPGEKVLQAALNDFKAHYDSVNGGFGGGRNKFPVPHNLSLLLRLHDRTGDPQALAMAEHTLRQMRLGGIWDHVGYGFHRYSTDQKWFLPHFEKMLYDQALHTIAYLDAHQLTGREEYAQTAHEILAYIRRDMSSPEGGFYSAEDADAEGEEGKFTVWTLEEIIEILGTEDAKLFSRVYNIEPGGNFHEEATGEKTGSSIPYLRQPLARIAQELDIPAGEFERRMADMRSRLFEARENRVHPYKDDKILTDWNGLAIAAFARGARVLGDKDFERSARNAADFALESLRGKDGRLLKRYRQGQAGLPAHIDDYAFLVWGLIELYEATFEVRYLEAAIELSEVMIEHFADERNGGFFMTADDAEELIVRGKDAYDGAIPSGNAVAACNLARLAQLTGEAKWREQAERTIRAFGESLERMPLGHSQMLIALDFLLGPRSEIVLAGGVESEDFDEFSSSARRAFLPRTVLLHRPPGEAPAIVRIAPFTEVQTPLDGKTTGYVCRNFTCELPVTDLETFRERLATLH